MRDNVKPSTENSCLSFVLLIRATNSVLTTASLIYIYKEDCLSLSVRLSVSVSLSQCIRTVFKVRRSNFTGTSMTPRDRSWRG